MKPEISIIVPVYKVEKYIHRCVDSILNQTFKDFELILVDDGSPDNCGKICDEYAHKDSRVKVIHKENGGVSSARNAGLDIAQGEYIGFVDSDDWIEPDMYELLYKVIGEHEADICSCEVANFYEGRENIQILNNKLEIKKYQNKYEILDAHYRKEIPISVYTKLIKREKIKNLRFKEKMISEDVIFSLILYNQIESLIQINQKKYIYFHRGNSITTSKISIKNLDNIFGSIELYSILPKKYQENIVRGIQHYMVGLSIVIVNEKTILKNREILKKIKDIYIYNKFIGKKKYTLQFKMYIISPLLFCLVYRLGKEIKKCLMFQR